ncbi:tryptophan--tRNA ligase [Natranaerofaba carboxydovora]|uniref:tryptophan--tRNA ligase n=1 Tax=Natranaerofaba carboxydovora TaxID=2742683 RepID=UPI001F142A11|nr:tryptophan--tRNA ligase [Natranaerofaba carboxydovora]UMZ73908.1 Tryptophan--tRNA ligase [Natranaerofaba carboxydovora]
MEQKGIIFSGMRPTGKLQLGNLVGALDNWIKLQKDHKCFFSVVDWHALTTGYEDTSNLRDNVREMVIDWLSAGLDPENNVIFRQSDVKEHAELHLMLSMITPLGWLERNPTYKEQLKEMNEREISTYGFLGYPVLQAADILLYKANKVPVGEDQAPHIELTREIARRFNHLYGEIFPEPQTLLNKVTLLPGVDGRKMSKSYGNTIPLGAYEDEIKEKVKMMVTDPQRVRKDDLGDPEVCTVYTFHTIFNENEFENFASKCREGSIGCVQCKMSLAEVMRDFLEPIAEKRRKLEENPSIVDEVLNDGAKKAGEVARQTIDEIKEYVKF